MKRFVTNRSRGIISSLALILFSTPVRADFEDMGGQDGMFVMAALGDSITTGFNSKNPLDNKSLSWSTGYSKTERVNSHYHRARDVFSGEVYQVNSAKAGARAEGLATQITNLKKTLKGRELDYMTLMIGANDVCAWSDDHGAALDAFTARVRATLDGALEMNPSMKITLVPVPNMVRLYDVGKAKGCSALWKVFPVCTPLLRSKTVAERVAFGERVRDLNDSLATIASDYPHAVHYAEEVATFNFEPEDISGYDCFHPSWRGQQKISEFAWNGGWYDRMPQDSMLLSEQR